MGICKPTKIQQERFGLMQFCWYYYSNNPNFFQSYFKLSVCRPNACNAKDYNAIVENLMDPTFPELFEDVNCQTKNSNKTFTSEDIATLQVIFSLT